MIRNIYFPQVMFWAFLFSMLLASIELSDSYLALDFIPIVFMAFLLALLVLIQRLLPKKKVNLVERDFEKSKFYWQLILVSIFFVVELVVFGCPLLGGSRFDFTGFNVLHVAFYGYLFFLNVKAASLGRVSDSLITFLITAVFGALLMTRQLIMYSFLGLFISLLFSGKIRLKSSLFLIMTVSFLFGFLGDLRESNVENFIYIVGGANDLGKLIPSGFYWVWLYIATPIYNLMYNLGDSIFSLRFENLGAFFSQIFVPEFLATRLEVVPEKPNLIVEVFNVSTGFGLSAKYAGLLGILIHTLAIMTFYFIGKVITFGKYKRIFIIHFSFCSIFFIFTNTFTRAEYFLVFIYIFLFSFLSKINFSHIMKKSGSQHAAIK